MLPVIVLFSFATCTFPRFPFCFCFMSSLPDQTWSKAIDFLIKANYCLKMSNHFHRRPKTEEQKGIGIRDLQAYVPEPYHGPMAIKYSARYAESITVTEVERD